MITEVVNVEIRACNIAFWGDKVCLYFSSHPQLQLVVELGDQCVPWVIEIPLTLLKRIFFFFFFIGHKTQITLKYEESWFRKFPYSSSLEDYLARNGWLCGKEGIPLVWLNYLIVFGEISTNDLSDFEKIWQMVDGIIIYFVNSKPPNLVK